MVERIVLVKLKEEFTDEDRRAEIADHTREALAAIPGVTRVTVGTATDEKSAADWDLCVMVGFLALDDIHGYVVHPLHRTYVDEYLAPKMALIKAWNFKSA